MKNVKNVKNVKKVNGPRGCDARLRLRVRSLSGLGTHARSQMVYVSDGGFCDRGTMRSRCFALHEASRGQLPTLKDSVSPLPHLPGEKTLLWAAVSVPDDTVWVLCGVSATALQTRTVPGTHVHSPLTLIRSLDR